MPATLERPAMISAGTYPIATPSTIAGSLQPGHMAMAFGMLPPAPAGAPPDEAWAYAERAVQHSKDAWRTIAAKQSEFLKSNGIDSEQRQLSNWLKFAKGEQAAAGVHVRVAREKIAKAAKEIDQELSKAPEASPVAAEIRAHVKTLPDPMTRMQFLRQACEQEDHDTIGAVLGGPAYLSGLTPADLQELRQRWANFSNPEGIGRRARLQAALASVDKASGALEQHVQRYITSRLSAPARAAGEQAA